MATGDSGFSMAKKADQLSATEMAARQVQLFEAFGELNREGQATLIQALGTRHSQGARGSIANYIALLIEVATPSERVQIYDVLNRRSAQDVRSKNLALLILVLLLASLATAAVLMWGPQ